VLILSVNKVWLESAPDKPISVGQLYYYENNSPCMVIKISIPNNEDSSDKDYFAIVSLETGWVGFLSESIEELEGILLEDGYKQVKSTVFITPG
jgi:hypothetical protein